MTFEDQNIANISFMVSKFGIFCVSGDSFLCPDTRPSNIWCRKRTKNPQRSSLCFNIQSLFMGPSQDDQHQLLTSFVTNDPESDLHLATKKVFCSDLKTKIFKDDTFGAGTSDPQVDHPLGEKDLICGYRWRIRSFFVVVRLQSLYILGYRKHLSHYMQIFLCQSLDCLIGT